MKYAKFNQICILMLHLFTITNTHTQKNTHTHTHRNINISSSSSSKVYVSTQFSNEQFNSGSHKCVQHISLRYAPMEFHSSLF